MKKLSLFLLFILTLCSCTKEINNINDFSKFSTMTKETDKIDVTFDNHSGSPFYFTIDNQKEINATDKGTPKNENKNCVITARKKGETEIRFTLFNIQY